MAGEIASAYVALLPSFKGGTAAISRELDGPAEAAGRSAGDKAGRGMAAGIGNALKTGLAAAGGGLIALGAYGLKAGLQTASGMEQAKISFTTMLGSAQKADGFLQNLGKFAATTPFEFPELQTAASSLISAGVNADKVIPIMTSLGNATSGMGTGAEGVKRATVALQQMNAAGKITGEDLNQLRDAGIPVYDLLAAATGKSKEEVAGLAAAGKLGRKELDQLMGALESGKGLERFAGLMDAQSRSLSGLASTFKDTLNQGLATAVQPLIPLLKDGLGKATEFATAQMPRLAAGIQSVLDKAKTVGPQIDALKAALVYGWTGMGDLKTTGQFKQLAEVIYQVKGTAELFFTVLSGGGQYDNGLPWMEPTTALALGLHDAFVTVRDSLSGFFASLAGGDFTPLTDAFTKLGPLTQSATASLPAVNAALDTMSTVFGFVASHIDLVVQAMPFLLAAFAAYKVLQVANNTLGKESLIGFGLQTAATFAMVGANLALAASNRALAASSTANAVATGEATAAENVGLLTRIRGAAATAASTVASFAARAATVAWTAMQWLLNAALTANPIAIVVIAIALLVGALIYAWNNSETFRNVVLAVWAAIKGAVLAVVNWLTAAVPAAWEWIRSNAAAVWNGISGFFSGIWSGIRGVFTGALFAVSAELQARWVQIQAVTQAVWNGIRDFFGGAWAGISGVFTAALNAVGSFLTTRWENLKANTLAVWGAILAFFTPIWSSIQGVFTTAMNAVGSFFAQRWENLKANTTLVWDAISGFFGRTWDAIKGIFSTGVETVKKWLSDAWESIKSVASGAWGGIIAAVSGAWGGLVSAIAGPVRSVLTWIRDNFVTPLNNILEKVGVSFRIPFPSIPSPPTTLNDIPTGAARHAGGGPIQGFSPHARADNIPIWATADEFMIRQQSSRSLRRRHPGLLEYLNQHGTLPGFAGGGLIRGFADGGLVGGISTVARFFTDPLGAMKDKVLELLAGVGGGLWSQVASGGLSNVVAGLVEKIKAIVTGGGVGNAEYLGAGRVSIGGRMLDETTASIFQRASAALGGLSLMQGSWSTSVGASGGTHAGSGAMDVWPSDGNWRRAVDVLRGLGDIAWHRTPAQGNWAEHIHGITPGIPGLAPSAAAQVANFRAGLNGLRGNGPDNNGYWRGGRIRALLADNGTILQPGMNFVQNDTGAPEPLVRPERTGQTFNIHPSPGMDEYALALAVSQRQLMSF